MRGARGWVMLFFVYLVSRDPILPPPPVLPALITQIHLCIPPPDLYVCLTHPPSKTKPH